MMAEDEDKILYIFVPTPEEQHETGLRVFKIVDALSDLTVPHKAYALACACMSFHGISGIDIRKVIEGMEKDELADNAGEA